MKNPRELPEVIISKSQPALFVDRFITVAEPGNIRIAFLEGGGDTAQFRARVVMSTANAESLIETLRQSIDQANAFNASTIQ